MECQRGLTNFRHDNRSHPAWYIASGSLNPIIYTLPHPGMGTAQAISRKTNQNQSFCVSLAWPGVTRQR